MRNLLVAVSNDPACKLMFAWLVQDELKPDDTLHILHVAMREQTDAALPGSDYFDQAHPAAAHQVVQEMLYSQFVAPLRAAHPSIQHTVHIVQASQDSKTVGRIICEKAEQLRVQQVFIGAKESHRSRIAATLLSSSVVAYVEQHCKVPATVVVRQGLTEGGSVELS